MSTTASQPFTCPFCNLYCQDLEAPGPGSGKPAWQPGCPLAKASFDRLPLGNPLPRHAGTSLGWDEAFDLARQWLKSARMPLVILTGDASCESQRAGVEFARRLRATVDTPLSRFDLALPLAAIDPGYVTCTLGEVTHNAGEVLFWGCQPEESHPRLLERLGWQEKHGMFAIHYGDQSSTSNDLWLKPGETVAFIEQARLLARGEVLPASSPELKSLIDFLTTAQYGVLFYGEALLAEGRHALAELFRLLDDLKGKGRWHAVSLMPGGNVQGTVEALSRITGFTQTVRFAENGAEFIPQDGGVERILLRNATDLVIFIGQPTGFSPESMKHLEEIPSVTLSSTVPSHKTLWLPMSQTGIHTDGTMIRLDGVTLPLSSVLSSELPRMEDVLGRLAEGVES
ncbi:MAG TPA: hypothetical protein VMC62_02610 [Longilinea sp.]|nr:hypothetical protein [Longilinea sp.]